MKSWFILLCLTVAVSVTAADATNAVPEVSVFSDRNLEAAVRQQVFAKRDTDKPLTAADVANVAVVQGNFRGITNLAGLEHCKALASVELAGNRIVDLSPLAGLRQLQFVHLASNRVENLQSLGTLPSLQYIQLESNLVTDASPLAACTNLASVYLSRNKLKTIAPLTNLPRVVTFYADGNGLKTVAGLDQLKWLTTLSLTDNRISDVSPLARLRAPSLVMLDGNQIKDLSPLYTAAKADLAGPKNWAPFLRLYLKGNRLSSASKRQVAELEKEGMRIVLK
jgi:Leucine-rich repeat (LRR) protein